MGTTTDIDPADLAATWFVDHESPQVAAFVDRALAGVDRDDPATVAVALFHAVRDGIRYDPYRIVYEPESFRASTVATSTANWCVPKSVLFVAAARHVGIPARLGFADVRNHLTSEKLMRTMGTDLFAWHGYAELLLPDPERPGESRWFKLSTAFNVELCERFGTEVLEFDGTDDALMHPFDQAGRRHMEYVTQRGSFDDLPLDRILADFATIYGRTFGEGNAGEAGDDAFAT